MVLPDRLLIDPPWIRRVRVTGSSLIWRGYHIIIRYYIITRVINRDEDEIRKYIIVMGVDINE